MTGQTINGYTITELIKEGGMAAVYKGENGFNRKAFKVVRPDRAENNTALYNRFLREIKILNDLGGHPYIVRAENVHNHNHTTVLEMEFLDGLDFEDYMKQIEPQGIRDKAQLTNICNQILEALHYAHKLEYVENGVQKKGILHLDVKPNNIFRTKSGYIKLLDFGIAKVVGEQAEKIYGAENFTMKTQAGESTFRGAIAYASPEQQAGVALDVTSDIFSFGKTLHFIATGTEDMRIECKIANFDDIIEKCTQQNPKKRYQTCQEVINAVNHTTTPTSPPPPSPPKKKCPDCHTVKMEVSRYCSECGYDFEPVKKCPKGCPQSKEKSYEQSDKYCWKCGSDLVNC